jgi:NodT family efflux transporter outer membrane factor (OMF) lipoprotein
MRSKCRLLGIALVLSGCAVGPNYAPPQKPTTPAYTRKQLPSQTDATAGTGGESQHFLAGRDLPGQWWTLFGSAKLSALIEQAMAKYPDIDAQQAALRAVRENVRAEQGVLYPQVRGAAQRLREKVNGAALAPGFPNFITNIYQGTVSVSYSFDIFGGERRTLEGLQAQAEAQRYRVEASYVTLTSNVASAAIQIASIRGQIAATESIVALEQRQIELIQREFDVGIRARTDVLQQQSILASERATLPMLQQQLAAGEHQLAVLTGQFPADVAPFELDLSDLQLPQDLPVSLPSALVEQRPDIKLQEMQMHQASAAIGVATANMLPQLTLTGATGAESTRSRTLLDPESGIWNVAMGIAQPIFEGGTLRARRRGAVDAYQQAFAEYRLTVLNAFQNVADTLTAIENDARRLNAEFDAVTAAKISLEMIQRQYDAGKVGYISLLTAQQTYQQVQIAYIQAVTSRYTDTVLLFQALGGGWWNRRDGREADGSSVGG